MGSKLYEVRLREKRENSSKVNSLQAELLQCGSSVPITVEFVASYFRKAEYANKLKKSYHTLKPIVSYKFSDCYIWSI